MAAACTNSAMSDYTLVAVNTGFMAGSFTMVVGRSAGQSEFTYSGSPVVVVNS